MSTSQSNDQTETTIDAATCIEEKSTGQMFRIINVTTKHIRYAGPTGKGEVLREFLHEDYRLVRHTSLNG